VSGGSRDGRPSDHPFVKGTFSIPSSSSDTQPVPSAGPSPPIAGNDYRKVSGVGAWGGWCTCPDGLRYNVGDNYDSCGSLACEGGTPGQCMRSVDSNRDGMKVTCAAGSTPTTSMPAPVPADSTGCAPFSQWPSIDGGVTCDACTALVLTAPFSNRCDKYCESFGHVCTAAAEEVSENCQVKHAARCDEEISGTSDMLCTCQESK